MSDSDLQFRLPSESTLSARPHVDEAVPVGLTRHADSPTQIVGARGPVVAAASPVEVSRRKLAILRDGRFVTVGLAYEDRSDATVWEPDGRARAQVLENPIDSEDRRFGWINDVQITHDGRLFVARPRSIEIFDSDLSSSVLVTNPAGRVRLGRGAILSDSAWVSSDPTYVGEHSDWFHVLAPDGTEIRSFCEVPRGIPRNTVNAPLPRAIARVSEELFVAAPRTLSERGYVLDVWSIEGDLVRRVRRNPAPGEWWADPVPYGEAFDGAMPRVRVQEDGSGQLWVFTRERAPSWRDVEDRAERKRSMEELYRHRLDVIDPTSWTLVYSGSIDLGGDAAIPNPPRYTRVAHRARGDGPGKDIVHLGIVAA